MPKLIVNGSNDRYWSTDSLSLYWDGLQGPKYVSTVPNAGHLLGDMKQALDAIGAFARMCVGEFEIVAPTSYVRNEPNGSMWLHAETKDPHVQWIRFWSATHPTFDFRDARWQSSEIKVVPIRSASNLEDQPRASFSFKLDAPKTAAFAEFRYSVNGQEFSLMSPVTIRRQ
jgi:PhoPQ-activated pathogenicity-related protein